MKIWISDTQTQTHRQVRFHCEEYSGHSYLGDLTDQELKTFLLELQNDMDVDKNMKLIKGHL